MKPRESLEEDNRQKERWVEYNSVMARGSPAMLYNMQYSQQLPVWSYTHAFFEEYKLETHLNASSKKVLQFGAADGRFIRDLQGRGWDAIAYEYAEPAVRLLQKKGVETKNVDLNATDKTGALAYRTELVKDLAEPLNILLVRILEYLEPAAMTLLLMTLIDQAAPGSVFFLVTNNKEKSYKSLFEQKKDIELLLSEHSDETGDDILVAKKTGIPRPLKSAQEKLSDKLDKISKIEEKKCRSITRDRIKTACKKITPADINKKNLIILLRCYLERSKGSWTGKIFSGKEKHDNNSYQKDRIARKIIGMLEQNQPVTLNNAEMELFSENKKVVSKIIHTFIDIPELAEIKKQLSNVPKLSAKSCFG